MVMLPWRLHRLRLLSGAFLSWVVLGFILILLAGSVAPLLIGMHSYVVRSGSMTPTIDTGDLEITRTISPSQASIGEIVAFKDPDGADRLISHRVRAVHERGGRYFFVTRGDANTGFERWNVPADGTLGEVVLRIPKIGYAVGPVASGPGRIGLVAIPALLLCVIGLLRIWAPERLPVSRPERVPEPQAVSR